MCKGFYKQLPLPPATHARVKALSARRGIPMTQVILRLVEAVEGVNQDAMSRVSAAALKSDPSPAMLKDVMALFGSDLGR